MSLMQLCSAFDQDDIFYDLTKKIVVRCVFCCNQGNSLIIR